MSRAEPASSSAVTSRHDPGHAGALANDVRQETVIAVRSDPDDLTGSVLSDRYRLVRILAQGGMGYVYRAEQLRVGKEIAVKVLGLKWADQPEFRTRFLLEARAASKVTHENVVEIHDVGEAPNGSVYLAMELLQGEDLAQLIVREGPLPWPRIKQIALQICRALHAAHERGVLHRDIKPENCWRTKRGANRDFIKVLDFGLAKIAGDERDPHTSLSKSGAIFGTPEYMSPEQARGKQVDARTDVYSMGVVLYELATGTVPFTGAAFMDVLTQQVSAEPIPPRAVAPHARIPVELEQLILRALRKSPDERFQTMREVAEALAAIPTHGPSNEPATTRHPKPRRPPPSRAKVVPIGVAWALSAVVVALALALVLVVLFR